MQKILLPLAGLIFFASALPAEQLPEIRPPKLGAGADSVANVIDAVSLMKKGQRDAAIEFSCFVGDRGRCSFSPSTENRLSKSGKRTDQTRRNFVSPQVLLFDDKGAFQQFLYPKNARVGCTVFAQIETDVAGKLRAAKIVTEIPPGAGYGESVLRDLPRVTFTPAYLNGKPIAATTTMHIIFTGRDSAIP